MQTEGALLEIKQVSVTATVGAHYLLQDISFSVQGGDRLAIVGPAGAGKTTLLRLLNRLSEPSQGSILLDGRDLRQIPVAHVRQQVMLLLQESTLLGMTVQEALRYPLELRKLHPNTIKQRIDEWMSKLHIPLDWLERKEPQLSGGQRQLVAIARACVTQPRLLLLDEPTASLDVGRSAIVMEALSSLAQQHTAILMVNHQLELAEQFSDRILYMQQGTVLLDQLAAQVNWNDIKTRLHQAEASEQDEWGD
jgi:D-methionine transport system ATP-binding protein